MYRAQRYDEVVDIVSGDCIWPYKRWAVMALAATGHKAEALRYAESCRGPWTSETDVDRLGEEILLSSGSVDEAYGRYDLRANRAGTYLATFRAVAKKYPHKDVRQILADLVGTTAGDEAKWFAAAKVAGLFDEALDLAALLVRDPGAAGRRGRDRHVRALRPCPRRMGAHLPGLGGPRPGKAPVFRASRQRQSHPEHVPPPT